MCIRDRDESVSGAFKAEKPVATPVEDQSEESKPVEDQSEGSEHEA